MQPPSGALHGQCWLAMCLSLPASTWPSSISMVYTTTGQSVPQVTHPLLHYMPNTVLAKHLQSRLVAHKSIQ